MDCVDVACVTKHVGAVLLSIKQEINMWSWINLAGQVFIVLCGIVAALVIALNEKNKPWVKALGITATLLVTGTTTLLDVLHVRENIDKLIVVAEKMASESNKFERAAYGKTGKELLDLIASHADDFNKQQAERLKILGSAGKLREPKL